MFQGTIFIPESQETATQLAYRMHEFSVQNPGVPVYGYMNGVLLEVVDKDDTVARIFDRYRAALQRLDQFKPDYPFPP